MKNKTDSLYRIIDANANRAREALRVCEEITRFILNHRTFSSRLKALRHNITAIIKKFPVSAKHLLGARESINDVGKADTIFPKKKTALEQVLIRNMKRAQEATRVLEEFSKIVSKKRSSEFQKIRFSLYTLEKNILLKIKK